MVNNDIVRLVRKALNKGEKFTIRMVVDADEFGDDLVSWIGDILDEDDNVIGNYCVNDWDKYVDICWA